MTRPGGERSPYAAGNSDGAEGTGDSASRARFVGRVEGAIRSAHQRDGRVQVRLSPPELGALRIELSLHQGGLSARIEAETSAARNMLLDNLPALRERLAAQDVQIERFDVDVRRDGSGSGAPGQDGPHDRPAPDAEGRRPAPRREHVQAPSQPRRPGAGGTTLTDAALDVRV